MVKSLNVNKTWKLFGGCIYNLEVLCWYILYACTKLRLPEDGVEALKNAGVIIKYLILMFVHFLV